MRTPAEFETAHIADSHNVPLDVLENDARDIARGLGSGGDIVLVCRSGQHSTEAHALLRDAGLTGGCVLENGIGHGQAALRSPLRTLGADILDRQFGACPGAVAAQYVRYVAVAARPQHAGSHHRAGTTRAVDDDRCAPIDLRQRIPQRR